MSKKDNGHKVFLILIPIGAILLAILFNYCYDMYHQIKLDIDTKDVINDIITKDFDNADDYKEIAVKEFEKKGYKDSEEMTILVDEDYLIFIKYHYFDDLRVLLNIFNIEWVDKSGYVNDAKINEGLEKKTGFVQSRYKVELDEYNEPVIKRFDTDENEFFLENALKEQEERERTSTTAVQDAE